MTNFDPHCFWEPNGVHFPPLTDELVTEAEAILGVSLPLTLIELLKIQNGGRTRNFAYPMSQRTTWATDHVPLEDLAGINKDLKVNGPVNLLETGYFSKEWDLPERQVILCGEGHWWITLDYRKSTEPVVSWIDVECQEDIQVAGSFAAFLMSLVPASNYR